MGVKPIRPGIRGVATVAAVLAMLIGGGHVVAWTSGAMGRVPITAITMKTNAGLGLLVAGLALVLLAATAPGVTRLRVARGCAAFVGLLGLATIAEHLAGWNLHIDQLLAVEPPGAAATVSPNRMGPPAALSFLLLGIALLLLTRRSDPAPGRARAVHEPFALTVVFLALLSLVGYLYRASELYEIAHVDAIAWPTALSLFVLGVGTLFVRPDQGWMGRVTADDAGGAILRALVAPMILLPLVLGWLRLAGERAGLLDTTMATSLLVLTFIITLLSLLLLADRRVREATAVLRTSESLFRTVVENSQDGINLLDLKTGRYVFLSPSQVALTGFTAEEMNNLPASEGYERVHPDDRHVSVEQQKRLADGTDGGGTPVEYRWKVKSGEYRWFSDSRKVVRDEQGRPMALVGVSRDITGQRLAQEALRRSEEKFAKAFHGNAAAMTITRAADGLYLEVNDRFVDVTGFSRDDAVGHTSSELNVWKDVRDRAAFVRDLERYGTVRDLECRFIRPDGGEWIGLVSAQMTLVEGEPMLISSFIDITGLKRAEQALRESEQRFRSVLDGARDVIYRVNLETGRYEYISPSCTSLVGFTPAELTAMDVEASKRLVHPDDLPAMARAIARLSETGMQEVEYRQRTKAGAYRWLSNHMSLVRDADGQPMYRDGNIRDVTRQKELEGALQRTVSHLRDQTDELERASRLKDEFLATLSHELRTPLNAILGWSDLLLRGLHPDTQPKALESIRRNAQAQSALISDILDVSRIITGKLRLELRPVDLAEVVRAACESLQPAADAKGVEIRSRIDTHAVPIGDPDRLQQVLWNLLSNSVKFTDRGGHVDVHVRQVDSHVQIVVRDDGAGISADFLPHVFERFRQADASTTRRHSGLGLGLALVRSLTELHGGTVAARSDGEGKGATFTITLPLAAVIEPIRYEAPVAADAPADTRDIQAGCLAGLHVVAVDDQVEARTLIRTVLERYGARVTTCDTAEQVLDAVTHERPDVLLADIGMPGCDGYDLIRRIRELPDHHAQTLPAVALTAYGSAGDRARALSAGFSQHVTKPILPDALVRVLRSVAVGETRR